MGKQNLDPQFQDESGAARLRLKSGTQWALPLVSCFVIACGASWTVDRVEVNASTLRVAAAASAGTQTTDQSRIAPVDGWITEYDAHIQREVAKASGLLALSAARMRRFCPKWAIMGVEARARFYADLLFAIAGAESRWKRTAMYKETGIIDPRTGRQAIDSITGYPIISEGLLQLSYTDMRNYPAVGRLACTFEWNKDKAAFVDDLAASGNKKSFHSQHPERSILNPYVQLTCGVHVLNTLVSRHPGKDFVFVAGRYWSTMRAGNSHFIEIVQSLKARESACF